MRLGSLVIVLAACSSSAAARPAWPKQTLHETDGGESLAPRAAARSVAARGEADRLAASAPDKPSAPAASAATAERPAQAAPAVAPSDEPVNTEDIIIEIEE